MGDEAATMIDDRSLSKLILLAGGLVIGLALMLLVLDLIVRP